MKQGLSLMVVLMLVGSLLFPTPGNAADADLTTEKKFDVLKEKGIFTGMADGSAGLNQNMNRAQFARVAALIKGLDGIGNPDTKVVTEEPFSDVKLNHWAVEEIAAAKEEGLFNGYPDGTFKPSGDVSVQELAVVVAGLLGIEPVEDAEVEGAADWAAGYIQALKDIGMNLPNNYTEPATRTDLVDASYAAEERIAANNEEVNNEEANNEEAMTEAAPPVFASPSSPGVTRLSITEVRQVGPKTFYVKFNRNVDSATIRLTVTRDGHPVEVEAVQDQANDYNLTFAENVQAGSYTVNASYADSSTSFSSRSVTATAERVTKLEFVHASDTIAHGSGIGIAVKASNQFGGAMSNLSGLEVHSNVPVTFDSNRMMAVVDASSESLLPNVSVIPISVVDPDTSVTVTKNFKIGSAPLAVNAEFRGTLRDTSGQEVAQADWTHTYHMNFDVYEQYGNLLLYPLPSGADSISTSITPYLADVSIGTVSEAAANEPGTFSLPITLGESGPEEGSAYTLTLNVGGATANQTFRVADSPLPILETPTASPAGGAVASGTLVSLGSAGSAVIYYTIDGSTPTASSTLYTGPISITSDTTVKAIAVQHGRTNSPVATFEYIITIPIVLPESIASVSQLVMGEAYTGSVAASGGTGALTYAITSGQLPEGLNLDENTGVISGTPIAIGTYSFTISATDSAATPATASRAYSMTIAPPAPVLMLLSSTPANVTLTAAGATQALAISASYDNGTSPDVTEQAEYVSSNENVATVSASGVVTAVAEGTANIVVTYGGSTVNVPVTVNAESRQLTSINAWIASYGVHVGTITNISVIAHYDIGEPVDVTAQATFELDFPDLASIDANGYLTGLKPGDLIITVRFLTEETEITDIKIL